MQNKSRLTIQWKAKRTLVSIRALTWSAIHQASNVGAHFGVSIRTPTRGAILWGRRFICFPSVSIRASTWDAIANFVLANLTLGLTRQFRTFSAHQSPRYPPLWFGCAYKKYGFLYLLAVRTMRQPREYNSPSQLDSEKILFPRILGSA